MYQFLTGLGRGHLLQRPDISTDRFRSTSRLSNRMGRTSKFSFPVPGRSKTPSMPIWSEPTTEPQLSKAQRILGTERSLNIDTPSRYARIPTRPVTSMSTSVSESTEGDVINIWDEDARIGSHSILNAKPSSTLLGQTYVDDGSMSDENMARKMNHQRSTSTIRPHYDRTKSPLAISQQTPASSTRDMALRKGAQPAGPPSRTYLNETCKVHQAVEVKATGRTEPQARQSDSQASKRQGRSTLSRIFSRSKKEHSGDQKPIDGNNFNILKHAKSSSKSLNTSAHRLNDLPETNLEAITEQPHNQQSESRDPIPPLTIHDTPFTRSNSSAGQAIETRDVQQSFDTRAPSRSESRDVPTTRHVIDEDTESAIIQHAFPTPPGTHSHGANSRSRPSQHDVSSKDYLQSMRASIRTPLWDIQSISSSKRTSYSVFSESDLRNQSVLSMSSDEDSDDANEFEKLPFEGRRKSYKDSETSQTTMAGSYRSNESFTKGRLNTPSHGPPRLSTIQDDEYLVVPAQAKQEPQQSRPWVASPTRRRSRTSESNPRSISPDSMASTAQTASSSRIMQVTKQEEALLSALRQRRAVMKDQVLQDYNEEMEASILRRAKHKHHSDVNYSTKLRTPPIDYLPSRQDVGNLDSGTIRAMQITQMRPATSLNNKIAVQTARARTASSNRSNNPPNETHNRINPHIDHPAHLGARYGQQREDTESSPDLSDFLSFGSLSFNSDEDPTLDSPRTSWNTNSKLTTKRTTVSSDFFLPVQSPLIQEELESAEMAECAPNPLRIEKGVDAEWPMSQRAMARLSAVGTPTGRVRTGTLTRREKREGRSTQADAAW